MSSPRLSAHTIAAALGQFPPTAEQTAVIESGLAPALVVAGAGSGKTETMASRVVWLVANGIVSRDEILGLTFTRKAAGELAERIQRRLARLAEFERLGLLPHLAALHRDGHLDVFGTIERSSGDRQALRDAHLATLVDATGAVPRELEGDTLLHRPSVATYNSFADQIVREHAVRVGRDPDAAVLSESAAWLLMRRVVLASDDPRLETRGEALRTIVDAALRIARDRVDNLVSWEDLARFPERFRDVLERPSVSRGVTVYADVASSVERVEALALLAGLARDYDEAKRRRGLIDFSDQVAGAFEAVSRHPEVGEQMRSRYRVVLLDEYQDTSVVQTDLLAALFADTAVMAVGDPHQAIYGWRGASAGNLGGFAGAFARHTACQSFALMTSWRNAGRVLVAANAVLAPLTDSAPVDVPPLRTRPDAPEGDVDVVFEPDIDTESDRVAEWFDRVRGERAAEGRATTGAVLFRNKKHMVRFADALGRRGIPHRILGLGGLLSTPEVVDVVAVLRVLSDPDAGSALLRLLSGPRWSIGLPDLRALRDLATRLARHDAALTPLPPAVIETLRSSASDDGVSLIDALDFVARQPVTHGWLSDFSEEGRVRLKDAGLTFGGLRRAVGAPIGELVRLIEAELRLDIELAANETRGPARIASAQLRAFVDEVHAFLDADDTGTVASLLAWLDHAERQDDLAPRTEPPEEDVVQLLTIHGSKGLEWDAVAVVRLVTDELPGAARDTRGWLGFGVLPYEFRGDRRWLPDLSWEAERAATQQDLRDNFADFVLAHRTRQLEEDRRLAYVAVTRARDHLLLSGATWSGTRKPRARSVFLDEMCTALRRDVPAAEETDDPYDGERRTLRWPLDPLGARRTAVTRAADAVGAVRAEDVTPEDDILLLLQERDARTSAREVRAPTRIAASRYKEFLADYQGAIGRIARPLPERPYRETRLGTLFHSWVEERSGLIGRRSVWDEALWEVDDETLHDVEQTAASTDDAARLARLQAAFLASEWAGLRPIEVECEIDFTDTELDGTPRVIVCRIDAVYRRDDRGGRIEIVDWKTGRAPRTESERQDRLVQLELYRRAYHAARGIPLGEIDVALFYVADDLVLRA
ncbi:ATP-dependent DNA helicase [Microbacterium aurantiacum]|uniref:ATP-dependent DNA helicase n=1 Tax=Microbacterium aurantiacum TaxID=162393 RepID=UPI003D71B63B